jgi:DNA mismatch endonuclease (patch repair protein)
MADMFEPAERSRIMGRIRSNGNYSTEVRFIRMMRHYGIAGWRRRSKLPGRPDFIFTKRKVAVFIDGDFWHGNPRTFRLPKSNCEYWEKKILGNRERDKEINRQLKRFGWRVLRIWESSLSDEEAVIGKLKLLI